MHGAKANSLKNAADSTNGSYFSDLSRAFDPLSPAYNANPYDFYRQAREQEPVFFSERFNLWVVTRYEDVMTILKDYSRFAIVDEHPWEGYYTPEVRDLLGTSPLLAVPSIVAVDPPHHTRLRICLNKAFLPQRISHLEPRIRTLADQIIDGFIDKGQVDIQTQFSHPYSAQVIGCLVNIPLDDLEQLQIWSKAMMALHFADVPAQEQFPLAQATLALHNYFYTLTEQHWITPGDDLVGDLLKEAQAHQEPLSIAEAASILFIFLVAGMHTTSTFLSNCFYQLLHERTRWLALLDDPESIPAVVEETLRLDPPGLGAFRRATETVEMGGKTIPAGALLQAMSASANHDPACFHDPEAFRPGRENANRLFSFGYGVHHCIGASLERLAVRVVLEQFSQRLPSLRLTPDQQLSYIPSLGFHGLTQLLLEWDT